MPVFTYQGKNAAGKTVRNDRAAENKQVLRSALGKEGIKIDKISEKEGRKLFSSGSGKVKTTELAVFFRQFSVMIDAGLPLVQCLEILGSNQENPALRKCLGGVRTSVEGGATLANAMRGYPKIFDDLTTNMVEAGETGGILDTILQRLAIYVEKSDEAAAGGQVGADLSGLGDHASPCLWWARCSSSWFRSSPTCSLDWECRCRLPTKFVIDLSHFIGSFWWVILVSIVAIVVIRCRCARCRKGAWSPTGCC